MTYIDTVLKKFNMKNFKKNYLSIGQKFFFSKSDYPITPQERERMSRISYASIVRSIMYVMIYTRLDVTYSLGVVSRYQSDSSENHWKVVKIILKYLRNTKNQWLIYEESDLKLVGFRRSHRSFSDRKSTRLNSSHSGESRMPSSA